ncbi:MAG TPA: hypothetical protein VD996_16945 [Chitinophagaceae bacterium]|nr:hypothetical protein [Chitinophagaceae bacterium]
MKRTSFLRLFLLPGFALLLSFASFAQSGLSAAEKRELQKKEDTLKQLSQAIVFGKTAADRFRADSNFVRALVRTLRIKNSFYYPLDSVAVSRLYSPDSAFRIFTWQVQKDAYVYLQKGAIQVRTNDGSLKLFPLHDVSMFIARPWDTVTNREGWIGAIYYKIILKTHNNKKYYTLLGFDDYSIGSNKKWMEVLTFNDKGEPVFGGPYINYKSDTIRKNAPVIARFNIEYKKEAKTFFNYDPELDLIVFDHLISETNEPDRRDTYIPDGDFEAFKWQNGRWVHVDKVFNFQLKDGAFPVDEKLYDDSGNPDEDRLQKQSEKNMQKANPPAKQDPKKPATPPKKGGGS